MIYFPGSIIEKNNLTGREFIDGMFNGAKGLVMSQIREFTGLNTPELQNWVNRGWLSRPVRKKYDENQVARILIINTLRRTMSFSDITKLLYYVNGEVEDESDDILSETELYGYACDVVFSDVTDATADECIERCIRGFTERRPGDAERLKKTLKIIYFTYTAGRYVGRSEELLRSLNER